jgi:hypothetical protein
MSFWGFMGKMGKFFGKAPVQAALNPFYGIQQEAKAQRDTRNELEESRRSLEAQETQRLLQWNEAQRQAFVANQQSKIDAENLSEQARSGAIAAFQKAGEGAAANAASGVAQGSSNYLALESSMAETERSLSAWRGQASTHLGMSTGAAGAGMARARTIDEINKDAIAGQRDKLAGYESDLEENELEISDYILGGITGTIGIAMDMYSIASGVSGIASASKSILSGSGMKLGDILKMDSGTVFKNIQGYQNAEAQGLDYTWDDTPTPSITDWAASKLGLFDTRDWAENALADDNFRPIGTNGPVLDRSSPSGWEALSLPDSNFRPFGTNARPLAGISSPTAQASSGWSLDIGKSPFDELLIPYGSGGKNTPKVKKHLAFGGL